MIFKAILALKPSTQIEQNTERYKSLKICASHSLLRKLNMFFETENLEELCIRNREISKLPH